MYNMSGHLPLLLVNPLKAPLTKTFNWQGPYTSNVNMVVAIFILIYMTSILLTFSVPIHEFSTFLLRQRDITSRHPFSFHDAKNISYFLFCNNCTALVVCPYMRIFPLARSVHLLFEHNLIRFSISENRRNPLSNLCSVQVAYEGQFIHIK